MSVRFHALTEIEFVVTFFSATNFEFFWNYVLTQQKDGDSRNASHKVGNFGNKSGNLKSILM